MCLSFLIRDKAGALSKHPHVLSLSQMSSTRVLLELSRPRETDGSSICLDKRWETIGLTVKDRNPSRVSVTLFSSDVLEVGQHRENGGVLCCLPLTYIGAILKVRAERKLIHSWHCWDVPRVFCGWSIQEMSTVVHTQLTPRSFTKKLKGLSLYSASHRMVIQSHTMP